ncbi:hypothetical protein MKEN_00686700 [Mycena kentingensis (nom. inval.)]|nr:hypothetical protein MKEN_00686700 [Mycena kentingensis (nom. inval.)]
MATYERRQNAVSDPEHKRSVSHDRDSAAAQAAFLSAPHWPSAHLTTMFRLLLAISSVSALTISQTCQNAFTSVASNSDANACLGISALISSFLQPNQSVITQVGTMVGTLCAAQPCSNETLSAVVANITTGCGTELSAAGAGSDSTASSVTSLVQQYYPVVRQIVCLRDGDTNCIVQLLTNIQNTYGQLSVNGLDSTLAAVEKTTSLPTNITCTDCIKETYNLITETFPSTGSTLKSQLDQCGSDFTDGSSPSNIVETAATTTGNTGRGREAIVSGRTAMSVIAALFLGVLA